LTVDLAPPRGTTDLYPPRSDAILGLEQAAHRLAHLHGYRYVETPAFEHTELFARTSGAGSDVVTKEMYTFEDKGGRSLTLRPEGTAPVVRLYLAHAHDLPSPWKAYYVEANWRHGRPQTGRYRDFRQFGLEVIGSEAPAADLMRGAGGAWGAAVLHITVCCAALSTLNATIFTGARVYYALGRDLPALRRLGVWDERGGTPRNGLIVQTAIALALILFGAATRNGFQAMVDYTAPVFWFFMLLVGMSLFVLRWREPGRDRPFRVPLYPLTPLLFCMTCAYLLYSSLAYTGLGAVVGIIVLAAGAPLLLISGTRETMPAE
jgi:hypothetical protein